MAQWHDPNTNEFMRKFARSMTTSVSWDKSTTTYRRAVNREQRKLSEYINANGLNKASVGETSYEKKTKAMRLKLRDEFVKKHPEMKRIKAINAFRHSATGRKFDRMVSQGKSMSTIRKSLGMSGGKSSSGRSSG